MPERKTQVEAVLTLPELRVLKALAEGGMLSLGRIGERAGLAGAASGSVLDSLASRGLVEREVLDLDGRTEVSYAITSAGRGLLEDSGAEKVRLPSLTSKTNGKPLKGVSALVPLFGSNRTLAADVGAAMAGCQWVGIPFAGSLCEVPYINARTVAVNDLHRAIINLATVAADPVMGPMLVRRLRRVPFHPIALLDHQQRSREFEEWPPEIPCLDWALNYFVSAWVGRNGCAGKPDELRQPTAIRWDAGGGDSAVRFVNAVAGLREWRGVLGRCTFTCLDAFEFLSRCKDRGGHGIYCDPPFPGPGDAYKHKFDEKKQRRLAQVLTGYVSARVVCRFYDVPLIRELYLESDGWRWEFLRGRKQTREAAPEVLIVRNSLGGSCE